MSGLFFLFIFSLIFQFNLDEFIDITPSTAILEMLGEIDFTALQCICELVDNSLDAFIQQREKKILEFDSNNKIKIQSKNRIIIKIPKLKKNPMNLNRLDLEDKFISVEDNGDGMDRAQLEKSLKAGFSGNDPINKLGLFGMGFNIATARLGTKTIITTSKKSDDYKHQVTIDFKELRKIKEFRAPIVALKKGIDERGQSGTTIQIHDLDVEQVKPLRRRNDRKAEIEKTYGKILRERGIEIIYDGEKCNPFQHCYWNPTRTGRDGIKAYMMIDEVINKQRYCTLCWNWVSDSESVCYSCGKSDNLTFRERKVKGWIGIQRFFDENHYGFDLIRNGRVIKHLYKGLFEWTNPNNGVVKKEYPIDGQSGMGRIIGELEIDFVPVRYTKDAFNTESQDWRDFISVIRDIGPLGKKLSKEKGYGPNNSYLAKLYSAFRGAKKGKLNLIPARADGSAMIRDSIIRDYKQKFFDREDGYIDDTKWWELILRGEKNLEIPDDGESSDEDQTGGDLFGGDNVTSEGGDRNNDSTLTIKEEDKEEEEFVIDENLSQSYSIDMFKDIKINVKAYQAKSGSHPKGFQVKLEGIKVIFKYWPDSKIFQETFLRPEELLINELAYSFFLNGGENLAEYPLSLAERSIKKAYFPDLHPEIRQIDEQIENLTRDLRDHMRIAIKKINFFKFNDLTQSSRSQIRARMFQSHLLSQKEMEYATENNEFITYADLKVMVEIFNKYPSTLFDGKFFRYKINEKNYQNKDEQEFIKDSTVIFWDIVWWKDKGTASSNLVWKGRSRRVVGSLEVIRGWRNE